MNIIAATVTSIVMMLAAGQDPAVYELPVIDGQAQTPVVIEAPDDLGQCAVAEVSWSSGSPLWAGWLEYPFEVSSLRYAIVGTYLWVQWDNIEGNSTAPDISKVELLPGTTTLEVCR